MRMMITTPATGKQITAQQYVERCAHVEDTCEHGHQGCAAWKGGPCFDEVLSQLEAELLDIEPDGE